MLHGKMVPGEEMIYFDWDLIRGDPLYINNTEDGLYEIQTN